jgi:hypothetical protein
MMPVFLFTDRKTYISPPTILRMRLILNVEIENSDKNFNDYYIHDFVRGFIPVSKCGV